MVQRKEEKSKQYFESAIRNLEIDMDELGTFAKVPSQAHKGASYKVRIDESNPHHVHATGCSCWKAEPCKHMEIVNGFYWRILHRQPKPVDIAERGTLNPQADLLSIIPSRQKKSEVA